MNIIQINPKPLYRLSPYLFMQFAEPLGTTDTSIDAAWDFMAGRWQPRAMEIVKRLAPPMLRWGGCFASYYHWKEGVGPQRVPMQNLCWDGIYLNQVGTAELSELAKECHSELLFCVNFESDGRMNWARPANGEDRLGTAEEAAEWVRYCNDPNDALRKSHGHAAPFNVRYWQIGNETSYDRNGYTSRQNAERAPLFIKAMRNADPNIQLIVWGDGENNAWQKRYLDGQTCDWTADICEAVGDSAEMVAFHNHFGGGENYKALHGMNYRIDADATWEKMLESTRDFEDRILYMEKSVAPYGRKLAVTEGHYAIGGRHRGDFLSSWYAGVAYARCANMLQRHGQTIEIATLADFMGNRWQNNAIMLPTPIRNSRPYFLPVGTIIKLFSQHIGTEAVAVQAPDGVDAAASVHGDTLWLHLVNLSRTTSRTMAFSIPGFQTTPNRILEIAANPQDEVYDQVADIFEPKEVAVDGNRYVLPAAGVAVIEFSKISEDSFQN